MSAPPQPIVVGVDGSDSSVHAAAWAAAEAERRHAPLTVLLVNDDPARADHVERSVRKAAAKCRANLPNLQVTAEVAAGRPAEVLLRRSGEAQLMVLGAHGRGRFTEAVLGGVSTGVATHASCPVVVVRQDVPTTVGPVVVGVDDSPGSTDALRFAFDSADRLHTNLVVIEAWLEDGLLAMPLTPHELDQAERSVEQSLARQTASLRLQHARVNALDVVQRGHPVAVLTEAARDARLLVVGHRGRGGFTGMALGSVAVGVLHHARCPVAIIRSSEA